MRKHQFYHFIRARLHSAAYIIEAREKMRKHQFYHFIRARLHSAAYIIEVREENKNVNFCFTTERD